MSKGRWVGWAAVAGGLLLTLLINYHSYLADFNLVPGDQGDTRLVVFTLEHWFNALGGHEAALELNMFYPDKLALGYADGLFLFAIPYAAFRALGLDYFTSYQLMLVVLTGFGYATYLFLLRRRLKINLILAVVGSVLLTCLNSIQFQIDIGKLLAFYLWPALILLLFEYARIRAIAPWRARANLAVFSGLTGLLFFTSYYPAWYFVFSALLFGVVYFVVSAAKSGFGGTIQRLWAVLRARKLDLVIAAGILILSLIPFWLTYAPLIFSNASRSFGLVLAFSPTVKDIFNVSARNYVWSPLLARLHFDFSNREVQLGSPWLVLLLFGVFYLLQVRDAVRSRFSLPTADRLMLALASTAVLIAALTVKIRGLSAWYIVYALVPGASALRAEGRYLMVTDMIVVVAVVYWLDRFHASHRVEGPRSRMAVLNTSMGLVCAFLIAEQVNGTAFRLDKSGQLAFMSSFQKPAGDCRAFFINNPTRLDLPIGYYQLDAMMVAMRTGVPTVNGYSGINPDPVFSLVPSGIEYQYGILNWLRANRAAHGICMLDYQTRVFTDINVDADYARSLQLVRDDYLNRYIDLFGDVRGFLQGKNDLANLYPQYLEEHGYMAASFGFQTGTAYHWIDDKYWIGTRACGKSLCPAIGIVGSYIEVEDIIEGFSPKATQVYFPFPEPYDPRVAVDPDTQGELLIVFPPSAFTE